eukprot:scaffold63669_cov60-Phaeocystis_antarctica.AAC.1
MLALKARAKGVTGAFRSIGLSSSGSGFQCSSQSHSRLGQLGTSMLQLETHHSSVTNRLPIVSTLAPHPLASAPGTSAEPTRRIAAAISLAVRNPSHHSSRSESHLRCCTPRALDGSGRASVWSGKRSADGFVASAMSAGPACSASCSSLAAAVGAGTAVFDPVPKVVSFGAAASAGLVPDSVSRGPPRPTAVRPLPPGRAIWLIRWRSRSVFSFVTTTRVPSISR